MRKSRTPGSVRGVSGNGYPYRDIAATDRRCSKICITGEAAAFPGHPYCVAMPQAPDHTGA